MNRYLPTVVMTLALVLALSACFSPGSDLPVVPETSRTSYRLGPGDQLDIKVLGADELRGPYAVQDDGTISMMLIGSVPAAGLTVDQLENEIAAKLRAGAYITKPQVGVSVINYRPFYILGEVVTPGGYPYASGMRVLSAVAAAHGYTYRANHDYVIIVRNGEETKADGLTPIRPDDIIRVPERYF
jgi:protein involved in polysaccharide export with SLBB domain